MPQDIGIDLGTKNTVVFSNRDGILLSAPSMVAFDEKTKEILAIGQDAYEMIGRTPSHIVAMRPMKDGVIADFTVAQKMIQLFIQKVNESTQWRRPKVLIGVPWGITDVERRAVIEAATQSGARETLLIDEPVAAAIGAGIPIKEPKGAMVVDIGGGTTEVGVLSLSGVVHCRSIRMAGDKCDESIIAHCRKQYNLLVGERMAEQIKMDIGSAYPLYQEKKINIKGRDLVSGLPKTVSITSEEIREVLGEVISMIIETIRLTLEITPPELSADIAKSGITLTGGGALLSGLDRRIYEETHIVVHRADDPLNCVARGTGKLLEDPELLKALTQRSVYK